MLLENLDPTEKEVFVNLAYLVAMTDGYLSYDEKTLINLYLKEMNLDETTCKLPSQPLASLCQLFSNHYVKKIAYLNLLLLSFADEYDNREKKCLLEIIQHEWSIKDAEASREETGLRIIKGVYMPCYSD